MGIPVHKHLQLINTLKKFSPVTVSYTHLDVYKRQPPYYPTFSLIQRSAFMSDKRDSTVMPKQLENSKQLKMNKYVIEKIINI